MTMIFVQSIKLGLMEDTTNRVRLAKILRFQSSKVDGTTSMAEYVSRMKPKQDHIYYVAGASRREVSKLGSYWNFNFLFFQYQYKVNLNIKMLRG